MSSYRIGLESACGRNLTCDLTCLFSIWRYSLSVNTVCSSLCLWTLDLYSSLALSAATSVSCFSGLMMPRFSSVSRLLNCRPAVAMLIPLADFGVGVGAGVESANAPFLMARDRIRGIAQKGQLQLSGLGFTSCSPP